MTATTLTPIQQQVYAAYLALSVKDQDWVRLAKLRTHHLVADIDRADLDKAIVELDGAGEAILAPDSNRKVLTDADHAAAILLAGEDNHLIAFPID